MKEQTLKPLPELLNRQTRLSRIIERGQRFRDVDQIGPIKAGVGGLENLADDLWIASAKEKIAA
ncbi:hypothetical protein A2697_01240 [Candidatus Curtissbacteria bacterium RIFCSPHIGHO2_01_FULL_41_44]|uniref:Uncharacterized protein n=1 Tax=Candidatus Curtissbacteria bacterium RIFCSPLOWO2_01_FULL_42_50 TaxID=1797730 RepID=A0A1F5H335_9BACT|nr:MAG: hypothetical protein A3C33_00460 [Candidatus Curtissbacteria bacterium RIFCSPHIGHO2_02_FULL_42_58]OGD94533.1 MAG: hypothetical protein A2697_01240 [Candidatus Curtissbacteria bacterium RIFCSPHIGHO2_01_FULL_41_44]OGD97918.1 MAG: hypothetical protein A3E71_03715 [Candidatus Curtissbacteria bacterium RIFCSPHIGHO2_12_FULL_42_33]OGD98566.1 MAG: hypothetical protein A3B54_05285 [Candidatus Curtissbacteria bacterium RIFCSPLOWO2_01_FULL_42_50]OGE02143.1 MAG: hypothetical protein A3G16_02145 [Ca